MSQPGYRFGLRQPCIRLNVEFSLPEGLVLTQLDDWIKVGLEAEVGAYQPIFAPSLDSSVLPVQYLRRLLLVTNILCQDVRIPLFERSVIIAVDQDDRRADLYRGDIWFPVVDGYAPKLCVAWVEIAQDFLRQICHCFTGGDVMPQVYERFQQLQVTQWLKRISGGKSTMPLVQGAFDLGIPCAYLGSGCYLLGWGCDALIFDRSSNDRDSAIGSRTTHHKGAAIQMMKKAGIPVPKGVVCQTDTFSMGSVSHLQYPLVVKPVDRDRGEGVSLGVRDAASLQTGLAIASQYGPAALIEEEVPGVCHRILVVKGQVAFVVKRHPRSITGDGVCSVVGLVDTANAAIRNKIPQKRLPEYVLDDLALVALAAQGLTVDSVPALGQKVALRQAQSTLWGGDPEVVTERLHPDNAEIAIRAASLFGLSCAGVDLITRDISVPWYENDAAINEVNYSPVLGRTHDYQREGVRAYLHAMFSGRGKIPIEIFVGAGLKHVVDARQQEFAAKGVACFVSAGEGVVDAQRKTLRLAGAFIQPEQIGMLQSNRQMGALLVYVNDPADFLRLGLPFDYVSRLVSLPLAELDEPQKRMIRLVAPYLSEGQAVEVVHAG